MRDFERIVTLAAKRKGGLSALKRLLDETPSRPPASIATITDDRILAEMTRRIFNAGFSNAVIETKWSDFELAFRKFDPGFCASLSGDHFDALMQDTSIVRNEAKIRSVQANAEFVLALAAKHGSAAQFFAAWPDNDYVGLLDVLKSHGNRLSGDAGMRFLRGIGKPSFILTKDVVAALVREQIILRAPRNKDDFRATQNAFNDWSAQSKYDLTSISRILAMSVDS